MTGLLGYGSGYRAMRECYLLLLSGMDFPYEQFVLTKTKIVQVDILIDPLGRRCKRDFGLCGDVRAGLQ